MSKLVSLHEAYQRGDLDAVRTLLGNPPDFPRNSLEYAIYHSPVAFVRTLLELGADPNYDGGGGFPSLLAALSADRAERYEIVELLLKFGANIQQRGINDYTPLHSAASRNDLPMIRILLAHGADPEARTGIDDFSNPFEEAEHRKCLEAAQLLKDVARSRQSPGGSRS